MIGLIFRNSRDMSIHIPPSNPSSNLRILQHNLLILHKSTSLSQIKQLHAQVLKTHFRDDPRVAAKLVSAYSRCRDMASAIGCFGRFEEPDSQLYNVLIRAYTNGSQPALAFGVFFKMQANSVFGDNFTYPFLLMTCSGDVCFPTVRMVHAHIVKFGFLADIFVPNALIDSYSRCGLLGIRDARKVFDEMTVRDTVSWNSMINGHVKTGQLEDARSLFDEMPQKDSISWNVLLDGYAKAGDMDTAFELFGRMSFRNTVSWSTLISGYCKAGDLGMARMLFDMMPVKSLVPWTIIISGFAEKGFGEEASSLYDQMEETGLVLDEGAIVSILAASAESGLLELGKKVHASIEINRFKGNTLVFNALVDMYAKSGRLDEALSIFDGMTRKDASSWNIMIKGTAMNGQGEKALSLYSRMKHEGYAPDGFTLIGLLCACTHAGFVKEGLDHFHRMAEQGIAPMVEHYAWMVDLLCRVGRLKEAFMLVQSMPLEPNSGIWTTLLGACRMQNDQNLAAQVLQCASKSDSLKSFSISSPSNSRPLAGDSYGIINSSLQFQRGKRCNLMSDFEDANYPKLKVLEDRHSTKVVDLAMEACFLSSNSFTKAVTRTAVRVQRRRGKAAPYSSVNSMCSSSFPKDSAGSSVNVDWRSFRARLVAAERELTSLRPNSPSSPVDLGAVTKPPPSVTVGDRWAHAIHEVEKGCLLVATEKLDGVHIFERTVILVLSTGPIGPTGIILNRPSLMSMKESRSSVYDVSGTFSERGLYFGGPIEDGLFLVRGGSGREAARSGVAGEVMEGLYYGRKERVGCVGEMVRRGVAEVGEFRFFDGCCGWVKGQLSDEVRSGYWTVVACSQSVIGLGSVADVGLWDDVLGLLGPKKVW